MHIIDVSSILYLSLYLKYLKRMKAECRQSSGQWYKTYVCRIAESTGKQKQEVDIWTLIGLLELLPKCQQFWRQNMKELQ